ncbi:MAG: M28 family peptidase [Cytophagales bacterium]|nr:M28 family peptidase [Bernardetiaceae bacterium]MDW8204937.1 M28 family peptidase [Cytophagales bacterium]
MITHYRFRLFLVTLLMHGSSLWLRAQHVQTYSATITQDDLKKYLTYIASDELEGRDTGSKGIRLAADYIVKHFKEWGLTGPVANHAENHFLQPVPLQTTRLETTLSVKGKNLEAFQHYIAINNNIQTGKAKTEIVFAGYGIDDEAYSDFRNTPLNVKNKAVVILNDEPRNAAGKYLLSGTDKPSEKWNLNTRVELLRSKGAKYVLIAIPNETFARYASMMKANAERGSISLTGGTPRSSRIAGDMIVPLSGVASLLGTNQQALENQLKAAQNQSIAGTMKSKLKVNIRKVQTPMVCYNVLGFIEGTDKKDEVIVLSAHYDHVGIQNGQIMNGADDDGSGVVAVMEMAQAFAQAKAEGKAPRRSILFLLVTAEEKGLLGSQYYADQNPIFPLTNTVANLNIDMIGRMDERYPNNPNYVYVIGSDRLSTDLHKIGEEIGKTYFPDLKLDYTYNDPNDPNRFYFRSDHYNFAKHGIPSIFYFNGTHQDYHQPTDDVEKIHFGKLEKITRYIFTTAWEIANRDERLTVDKKQ